MAGAPGKQLYMEGSMKKMKRAGKKRKLLGGILAALLFAGALAGCGGGDGESGPAGGTESTGGPGSGDAQSGADGNAKGRFLESEVALPEEVESIYCMGKLSDGKIEVVAKADGAKCLVFLSGDGGESWTTQEAAIGGSWISGSAIAPDGTAVLAGTFEGEEEFGVKKIAPDGSVTDFPVALPESGKEYGNVIFSVLFDASGRMLIQDMTGMQEVNMETGECTPIDLGGETVSYSAVAGEKLIVATGREFKLFDTATKEALPDDAVLDGVTSADSSKASESSDTSYPMVFTAGGEPGSIMYADDSGIYFHVDGASVNEQLVNGELNSLGGGSCELRSIVMVDDDNILVQTMSTMDGHRILRYRYDETASAVPDQELTVYALHDSTLLRQAVALFQKENSGVFVKVQIGRSGDDGITAEDAVKTLNTEIMAGNVPDVLVLDGLPVDSYIEKGLLADISGVVEEIDSSDGLFANIKNAYERDGAYYCLPARFYPVVICGVQEALEAGTSLDTFADYVGRAKEENPDQKIIPEISARGILWTLFKADSANWLKEDQTMDQERLTNWLKAAKTMYDATEHSDPAFAYQFDDTLYGTIGVGAMRVGEKEAAAGCGTLVSAGGLADMLAFLDPESVQYGYFNGRDGKSFTPHLMVGISSTGNDQETAGAFLKTFLGKECGGADQDGFPVNRAGWKKVEEDAIKKFGTDGGIGISISGDGGGKSYQMDDIDQEVMDELTVLLESLTMPSITEASIEEAVLTQGESYLKGTLPLEDAVSAICQKMNLYFAE